MVWGTEDLASFKGTWLPCRIDDPRVLQVEVPSMQKGNARKERRSM